MCDNVVSVTVMAAVLWNAGAHSEFLNGGGGEGVAEFRLHTSYFLY